MGSVKPVTGFIKTGQLISFRWCICNKFVMGRVKQASELDFVAEFAKSLVCLISMFWTRNVTLLKIILASFVHFQLFHYYYFAELGINE